MTPAISQPAQPQIYKVLTWRRHAGERVRVISPDGGVICCVTPSRIHSRAWIRFGNSTLQSNSWCAVSSLPRWACSPTRVSIYFYNFNVKKCFCESRKCILCLFVFWINANKLAALLQYLFIRILCQVKSQKAYFLRITHFIGYIITPIGGDKWVLCVTLFKNWTIQSFRFPLFCSKHWFI